MTMCRYHATPKDGCRLCHLARTDPAYMRLWGLKGWGWGDYVWWLTKVTGVRRLVKRATGGRCGCDARRKRWNQWPTPRELWARLWGRRA